MSYCIEIAIILLCLIAVGKSIKRLIAERGLIFDLAVNDLKVRYAGSTLGIFWAFAQPALTTFIYWFVFQLGFKSQPVANFPFILWLVAGLTPWFYFGEAVITGTGSIQEYSYLVKKVMFNVNILPAIKTISLFLVHVMFVVLVCVLFLVYGVGLTLYALQVIYYAIAMLFLAMGLIYLFSALQVFLKDTVQIISVLTQFLFWSVPIVWDSGIMPASIQAIIKINPLYYIIEGYRDAFVNHIWFWEKIPQTLYFWSVTMVIFTLGIYVFKRLTPHFADVL